MREMDREFEKLLADVSRSLKELAELIDRYLEKSMPVEARLEMLKEKFPENLKRLVTFEAVDNRIVVKPRGYLGNENFKQVAEIIRDAGGEYVSAGKESHFLIPKR